MIFHYSLLFTCCCVDSFQHFRPTLRKTSIRSLIWVEAFAFQFWYAGQLWSRRASSILSLVSWLLFVWFVSKPAIAAPFMLLDCQSFVPPSSKRTSIVQTYFLKIRSTVSNALTFQKSFQYYMCCRWIFG